jgi:hypothetical protein
MASGPGFIQPFVDMSRVTVKTLGTVATLLLLSGTAGVVSQEVRSLGDIRSSESIMLSYGLPFLSGVTHLCQERVYADRQDANRHITWDAFSSSLEPSQVVDFFRRELGNAGFSPNGGGGTWRFPVGSESPNRVLTVLSVEEKGPHSKCKEQIPSDAKSVLILSRKT